MRAARPLERPLRVFLGIARLAADPSSSRSPARRILRRAPSYKLTIDFGLHGKRTSSVGVREWYAPGDLEGRLVACVMNLPPRQVGPVRSKVLTMGAVEADGRVVLLQPNRECEVGARIA